LINIGERDRGHSAAAPLASARMHSPDTDHAHSGDRLTPLPLHALHVEAGAKMVPFAGYEMPINYPAGILAEHRWCRSAAALFDVSHMGQLLVHGHAAGAALESLIPADLIGLEPGQARYCVLMNDAGGVRDDLIVTRIEQGFHVVVNASRHAEDVAYMRAAIGSDCTLETLPAQCLLAIQGPAAAEVVKRLGADIDDLPFMRSRIQTCAGATCRVTRSGYTGEDGFELSTDANGALAVARALLDQPEVRLAGLGARDSLRLEAGLCLYGHELDEETTPLEADLGWTIQKVRRSGGARAGGYPGADVLAQELASGTKLRRVGLAAEGRTIVRDGAELFASSGEAVGHVTSGGFSPTLERPIAMGYVAIGIEIGDRVTARVRGRDIALDIVSLPFVPHRYFRKAS
jgi:aminomethyltransferase